MRVEDLPVPAPGPGEILLRSKVALTCGTDVKVFRRGYHARMLMPPAVFGHEVAGVVEAIGPGVEGVAPGTPVVVANSAPCGGLPFLRTTCRALCDDLLFWNGAYAQFSRIPARIVSQPRAARAALGSGRRRWSSRSPAWCAGSRSWHRPGPDRGRDRSGPIGLMFVVLARLRGAASWRWAATRERLAKARAWGPRPGARRRGARGPGARTCERSAGRPRVRRGDRGGGQAETAEGGRRGGGGRAAW